jgi:hypothetical protein
MPRKLLLFAAIAVIGSMLGLWLVTRDSSSAASTSTSSDDSTAVVADRAAPQGERPRPALPNGQPAVTPENVGTRETPRTTDDPTRPQATVVDSVPRGTNVAAVREPPLEYTLPDGRRVRDFRDPKDRKPLEIPPSVHAPGGRKIDPSLTSLYTDEIVKAMRECAQAVPANVRGAKPRLEGQIVIAIKQAQGSVTNAVFKITDISSESIAETGRQCVEQRALSVKVPATGEADLDSYSINLSFAFP